MSWLITLGLALGALGLALMLWDYARMERRRKLELARLHAPATYTFAKADEIARRRSLATGQPHHAKLTGKGRWIVVAMEDGE